MSDSRVVDHLEDEIWKSPGKLTETICNVIDENEIYEIAAAAIVARQYHNESERSEATRLMLDAALSRCLDAYVEKHRDRAERELRQMDADNAADARADAMQEAA